MSELFTDEDQNFLDLSQRTRRKIITDLLDKGKGTIPEDESDRALLIKALDGGDKQVLAKTKLQGDREANKTTATMQQQIAEMYSSIRANASRPAAPSDRELPNQNITLVPGHMDLGRKDITLQEVMKDN